MGASAETAEQTVIITGGNSGLGYECAGAILAAGAGWHVVIAGRSQERMAAAVRELQGVRVGAGPGKNAAAPVSAMRLDLASLRSVRQFVGTFTAAALPPLRGVICNAGIQVVDGTTCTEDGFEATFGVNHLGHFLLVNLLLPYAAAPGRFVFVSSDTHDPARRTGMPAPRYRDPQALAWPDRYPDPAEAGDSAQVIGRRRYTTSKLCNVLCAYELGRRLAHVGLSRPAHPLTSNAFNPGMMPGTGLARGYKGLTRVAWDVLLPAARAILCPAWLASPRDSGQALARLLLDPVLAQTTAAYFSGADVVRSSDESYDAAKAAELWEASVELVRLSPDEMIL